MCKYIKRIRCNHLTSMNYLLWRRHFYSRQYVRELFQARNDSFASRGNLFSRHVQNVLWINTYLPRAFKTVKNINKSYLYACSISFSASSSHDNVRTSIFQAMLALEGFRQYSPLSDSHKMFVKNPAITPLLCGRVIQGYSVNVKVTRWSRLVLYESAWAKE